MMQANLLNLAALKSEVIEVVSCFLTKPKIAVIGTVVIVVVVTAFVWKILIIKEKTKKKKEDRKRKLTKDLRLAVEGNDRKEIKQALENGADINQQSFFDGRTVLTVAATQFRDFSETIELLLENKADISKLNNHGSTALTEAAGWGLLETVKLLLAKNADINQQNSLGNTALTIAISTEHSETVEFLLATNKVDFNKQENEGYPILMRAVSRGVLETVKLLLRIKQIDINEQDIEGETVLMNAAAQEKASTKHPTKKQNFTNIIDQLLTFGADPLVRSKNDGTTVLEQVDSETIRKYMRGKIPGILKKVVSPQLSRALPDDLANIISELTY